MSVERLAAIIRRDADSFSRSLDLALVADARAHGVAGLVAQALRAAGTWPLIPDDARQVLEVEVRRTALGDGYFRRQTRRAVRALRQAGVPAMTFKGEALALTHYSPSHLRPRCDTDLIVEKRDVPLAGQVLERLGYSRINTVMRDAVCSQQTFTERGSMRHVIDLHWDVSYRPFFAGTFRFDELTTAAVAIGDPADGLLAPNQVHALVLACLHRVVHHENSERLIWLYDISVLASRLSDDEWTQVREIAAAKSLCDVCATGTGMAAAYFGCSTPVSNQVAALRALGERRNERSRAYLGRRRGPIGRILLDARHAGTLTRTLLVLAGHAFPDREYMRRAFGAIGPVSLAGSYVHRAARGIGRYVM